jgi:pyruvate kinase
LIKTRIVCTIGPSSDSSDMIEKLILSGMDVARINTSHSSEGDVVRVFSLIRNIAKKHDKNTAIMLDLQGPKIRIGKLKEDVLLNDGQEIIFTTGKESRAANSAVDPRKKNEVSPPASGSVVKKSSPAGSKNNIPLSIIENININSDDTDAAGKKSGTRQSSFIEIRKDLSDTADTGNFQGLVSINVDYPYFLNDIKKDCTIFIDDGLIECKILKIDPGAKMALARVVKGGILKSGKGINLPGVPVSINSITEKDMFFLDLAMRLNADFVAQSFVRSARDVSIVKNKIHRNDSRIMVIPKIEKYEAVDNFDSILEQADGVMVARGDLGIELPAEDVPVIQKQIIKKANIIGKPVITATQMLDSMIRNPRPTRAEVSDVANAILDGSDALMLSGETAAGKYPLEALKMMIRVIEKTEESIDYEEILQKKFLVRHKTITESISFAACEIATVLNAAAIITATQSGSTARQISKNKPRSIIIGASPDESVIRQLMLSWGVIPVRTKFQENINEMIAEVIRTGKNLKIISKDNRVVITGGIMVNKPGSTNFLHVKEVE